jgi:hypothetical protein
MKVHVARDGDEALRQIEAKLVGRSKACWLPERAGAGCAA